jgi:4'-phosphopantetheinyl transferase
VRALRVLQTSLAVSDAEVARCRELLNGEERARADRFKFERHRRRFTVARAFLRETLAEAIGAKPCDVELVFSFNGKPSLANGAIEFNLSHSHELAVIALAETPVGIDVEYVKAMPDALKIAERFFASDEIAALQRSAAVEHAFFRCWTGKEAYLKARAEGIGTLPLDSFSVSLDDDAKLLRAADDDPTRWQMERPRVADGYICTVAVGSPERTRK